MADVVELGPHERMTPEQALAIASNEEWDEVIICGYLKDNNELAVRTSRLDRKDSLWIAVHLALHCMGRL